MKRILLFAIAAVFACACTSGNKTPEAMSAIDAIMSRRSIRAYKAEPVARETMDIILKCSINAPSGINLQPWALRVVDNQELLADITSIWAANDPNAQREMSSPGFRNMFRNAPTVVFVASPEGQGEVDCGMLAENMMISAQALGVGSCCLGGPMGFLRTPAAADFVKKLQLPEGYSLLFAIALGYPDESPEARPRDESKVMYIE